MTHLQVRHALKIAIIGFGAIGSFVIDHLVREPTFDVAGVLSKPPPATKPKVRLFEDIDTLLVAQPDVVVECAGHQALKEFGELVLRRGSDLLVASIGALADSDLEAGLHRAACAGGSRLLIPGGALGGIDAIGAAREAGLTSVYYVGRKAPSAWKNTAAEGLIDLDSVKQATVFLECDARHAALQFPQNANVVAALALAGLGFERTRVQLIVDPAARGNAHSIMAHGTFGEISATIQSTTLPSNPKTSVLAPYSLIHCIKRRAGLVIT
jgi:aspartate dehydrogenase